VSALLSLDRAADHPGGDPALEHQEEDEYGPDVELHAARGRARAMAAAAAMERIFN
jgi:hypothetical protein